MKSLIEQYKDCCDRIYLNKESVKKSHRRVVALERMLDKDEKEKRELELKLGL